MSRTKYRFSRMRCALAVATLFWVLLATPQIGRAQPSVLTKGKELKRLDYFAGQWQGQLTRFLPGDRTLELQPELTASWKLGGAWLQSDDTTALPGSITIHNRSMITWSKEQGKYLGTWQDNTMAETVSFSGQWLEDNVLKLDSGKTTFRGRPHRVVLTYTIRDEDHYETRLEMSWNNGDLNRVAQGEFARRE